MRISSAPSNRSNHTQNRPQINLHILMRRRRRGRCVQTFNGLSFSIPGVQKLNKYLCYKHTRTSADSRELSVLPYSLPPLSLRLTDERVGFTGLSLHSQSGLLWSINSPGTY